MAAPLYAPQGVDIWLWNEQVPPGVKYMVVREHSVVDEDHKSTPFF